MSAILTVLVALAASAPISTSDLAPDEVQIDGERWRELQPQEPVEPGAMIPMIPMIPMILRRELEIERVEGGVQVHARWFLTSVAQVWFANQLAGSQAHVHRVRWNGREAAVWSGGEGPLVVERIDGEATLEFDAFVPGDPQKGLALTLMGAPRGTVTLEGFAEGVTLEGGDERPVLVGRGGAWSTGASFLQLSPARPAEPRDRGPLVVASVGLGVTVGDAEIRGRARLRWEIRQGARRELRFAVHGVGEDLTVEGPQVQRWRREGEDIVVDLGAETRGRVDLDLRWSIAAPKGAEARVALPTIVPHDVFRSTYAVQLARDGEIDVRPSLGSWTAIASVQLTEWAKGLVEGAPTATYTRTRAAAGESGALELLRLEPVPGPPMVVDVADLHVATTQEGRVVMRARYEVRNERASHLVLRLPPGMRLVGVRVAGQEVRPGRAGDDERVLRIPMKRSIETVQGLLTVPVTVGLIGESSDDGDEPSWDRRERRELELPVLDAPITVERVTVRLPPRYHSRIKPGQGAVVEYFDRGESVGYGLDDDELAAQADEVFADAVDAWNANEFERAQNKLDELEGMGVYGENANGLQANVDLVRPRKAPVPAEPAPVAEAYDFDGDELESSIIVYPEAVASKSASMPAASAVARRIRSRARARSGKKRASYNRRKRKAKVLRDEGRYDEAAAEYRRAIEDSRDLDALEDEESVEYEFEADELAGELEEVEAQAGGGESESSDSKIIMADDGEFDLVSISEGFTVVIEVTTPTEATEEVPYRRAGSIVVVPRVGEEVLYQHLLLAEGERRTVRIDARRERVRRIATRYRDD